MTAPTVPMVPGDWLARRAALGPDDLAILDVDRDRRLTFAELEARTNRTARWLEARGVEPGDRVAVLAHNRLEYVELLMACQKTGAVLQNLNWRLHPEELASLVRDAAPKVRLVGAELAEAGAALGEPSESLDGEAFASRAALDDGAFTGPTLAPSDPWILCYTGGSTGTPKGAVLTHGSVLANAWNTIASWGLRPTDRAILNAPMFHTGGLNVFTTPLLYLGGAALLCTRFDVDQVFDLVEAEATLLFGVPTMFQMMMAHPRWPSVDLSRLRVVISGGAPCPPPVFEAMFARGVTFKTGYGLTEAGPNNFWLPDALAHDKPGCVGRPLMHVETRIVEGELWLRGPHLFAGYRGRPEATAEALDTQGWLHTGDLARVDADGDYWIQGRKKDLIISGGENIYPAEVERALVAHPEVAEAAVVAAPDARWGEVPVAFVVGTAAGEALRAFLKERLAAYKVPKRYVAVDAMPLTGAGKVDRRALAARAETAPETPGGA